MIRNKTIKIRVSEAEYQRLRSLSGKAGVSAFLRIQALGPDRRLQIGQRLMAVAEIARIRNLLVQVARASETRPAIEQLRIVAQLVTVEQHLCKITIV